MKYNQLNVSKKTSKKRVGRGIAGGQGKTAGRGTKGQGARKSGGVRPGFEGGQMPLYMRLPKLRGFKSKRTPAEVIYTGQLSGLKQQTVDNTSLHAAGLVSSPYTAVKLIVKGEVVGKKQVSLQAASATAVAMLEMAGGSFKQTDRQARPAQKK